MTKHLNGDAMFHDLWETDVPPDRQFQQAAESFGGALDLRPPEHDPRITNEDDKIARTRSRLLFIRPLNIIHRILRSLSARSGISAGRIAQVRIGYIYSTIPNAYCWLKADQYYIGVTSGFGHLVHGWASSLLSMPDFLPTFVDGAQEEIPSDWTELRKGFEIHKLLAHHGKHIHRLHPYPKSTVRLFAAHEIAHMAILFAFLHELGHFLLRHLDFAREALGISHLKELRVDGCSNEEQIRLSQLFEIMSDNFAIEAALCHKIGDVYSPGPTDSYAFWSTAVDLTLWFFGYGTALSSTSESHPHPQVRLLNKFFKLSDFEKGHPGHIVCYPAPGVSLPIDRFCQLASVELAKTWQALALPGWASSCLLEEEAQRTTHNFYAAILKHSSPLREKYDGFADWSLISEMLGPEDL